MEREVVLDGSATRERVEEKWWKTLKLECFLVLCLFSAEFAKTPLLNLYMDRVCLVNYNYTEDECANRTANQDILDQVQEMANNISLYSQLIVLIPGVLMSFFLGPFSDKYGRKKALVLSMVGSMSHYVCILLFSCLSQLPVQYFLLATIPTAFTGQRMTMMGSVYALLSDKTLQTRRTFRFAVLELTILFCKPTASLTAGQLYKYFGYYPLFAASVLLSVVALIFLIIFISDDRVDLAKGSWKTMFMDFFSLDSVRDNIRVCFKERDKDGRRQIWVIIVTKLFLHLAKEGLHHKLYLFCNKMYGWDLPKFNLISNCFMFANLALIAIIIPSLMKLIKIRDSTLGLVSTVILIIQSCAKAFATKPWIYYATSVLDASVLPSVCYTVLKSKMASLLRPNEQGKVFALMYTLEEIVPSPMSAMYTEIYNDTLESFVGAIFLVGATFLLVPIASFAWFLNTRQGTSTADESEGDITEQEASDDQSHLIKA